MSSTPDSLFLGNRLEGTHEDFDGVGPRVVSLRKRSSLRPGAWVADVDPPIPSPDGRLHDTVLIFPRDDRRRVWPEAGDSYAVVAVGPAPGTPPTWFLGSAWYQGETALAIEDLPPTRRQTFEEIWDNYQHWLAEGGKVNPPTDAEIDGFPIGQRIGLVKSMQQNGLLEPEVSDRFGAVPGFAWRDVSVVDWLRAYAEREGDCDVPLEFEEGGRRWGREVESLVKDYLRALDMERLGGPDSVFMSRATRGTLDGLPGWMDRVGRSRAR